MSLRSVVFAVGLSLTLPLFAARIQQPPSQDSSDVLVVQFSAPLATADAANFIARTGVQPIAFEYEENGITGGYVLTTNESPAAALESFRTQHEEFLAAITQNLRRAMEANAQLRSEANTEQLLHSFEALATDHVGVRLSGMRVKTADSSRLLRESAVRSVAAVSAPVSDAAPDTESSPDGLVHSQSLKHESWAPSSGYSDVNKSYTSQTFFFNKVSDFDSRSTYESETQVYDKNFANFGGYWSSNMPSAYYDTPFLDSIDNFTVGSAQASSLKTNTAYYTFMTLKGQTAKTAQVRVKGQKGHRTPSWCYSTWCIFADATTGSLVNYTVPAGVSWQY